MKYWDRRGIDIQIHYQIYPSGINIIDVRVGRGNGPPLQAFTLLEMTYSSRVNIEWLLELNNVQGHIHWHDINYVQTNSMITLRLCSHLQSFSNDYGQVSMGERLSKLDQSCFSDPSHIEVTWDDSYMSDNVWAIRLAP